MDISGAALRRCILTAIAGVVLSIATLPAANAESADFGGPRWVATWSAPPMAHGSAIGSSRSFDNQTVRQVVHISAGGTRVRVKLSNEYGAAPLIIGSARIAVQSAGASIVPATDRPLTFNGQTSVVIPAGGTVLTDSALLPVLSNANLAVSLYVPQNTGFATYHQNAAQTAFISGPGDFSAAADFPTQETAVSRYWISFVEVLPVTRIGALAIFGDSISEGNTTTLDANKRVVDVLSERFNPRFGIPRLAVLNQATGCGRLLMDFCGPSGLSRFEREVLNATGVTQVLVELGLGDIIFPTAAGIPEQLVSAEQIIAGLRELIARAHARGLRIYGATIPPNEGTTFENVHTPENEAKRLAVNQWIRTSKAFDAVVDYDKTLRDPDHPARLLADYAAPDKIHPDDEGHEALARALARVLH